MDTRPPRPQRLSRDQRQQRWLVLLASALALVTLTTGLLQWRQHALIGSAMQQPDRVLAASFLQLEAEQLRLRGELQQALAAPRLDTPGDIPAGLQLRYDSFVSRVGLIDHPHAAALMAAQPGYDRTMTQSRAFIAHADHYLAARPEAPLSPAALLALGSELDALAAPLHELSLAASDALAERLGQQHDALRTRGLLGLALIGVQCALLVALAVLLLRHARALAHRRERLQRLADGLGAARERADAASRAKSVFLANMSHEIRTPFHGMLGMMSLLHETPLSAQQTGYLRTARESAQHLLAVLNDVLDISKLESGMLHVVPEPVDLARLVREVDALMRVQAQAKGLAMNVTMDTDVPRWVRADPTRLKQILFNLLANAVKFTAVGHVHLKVECGVEATAGTTVFSVIDTGIGMDEATQARVFQRFVQGDDHATRQGGAGLGLEISRSLSRLMGGDIAMRSVVGEGSTFVLTLPLPRIGPPAPGASSPTGTGYGQGRSLKVLVAEDHPVNRAYLEAVLDKLGHQAVFAENGEEAVREAQSQDFDIVLMDLHMPVMDGFAAARAIRALPLPRGAMPIVALTADAFRDSQDKTRLAGMDEMLTKPAHLPQLRELLARYGGATAPTPAASPLPAVEGHDIVDRSTVEQLHAALSPQKYAALLGSFFDAHPRTVERLRSVVRSGDRGAVWNQAHALKGAALSLGLRAVVQHAETLKQAAVDPARPDLNAALDTLERHLLITRDLCLSLGWLAPAAASGRTVS